MSLLSKENLIKALPWTILIVLFSLELYLEYDNDRKIEELEYRIWEMENKKP
jgi:hypothetical protein